MSVLRACPFCGGEANCSKHFVFCTVCHAESDWIGDDGAAIAAWNRRAPDYAAGAEAMREAAVQFHREEGLGEKHLAEAAALNGDKDSEWKHRAMQTEHRMSAAAIRALPLPEPPK
jgi:hypothetical protein